MRLLDVCNGEAGGLVVQVSAETARRRLLTIAVADYKDGDEEFTSAVRKQLKLVDDWWGTTPAVGRRFTSEHADPLTCRRDVENFLHHSGVRDAEADDVLVLYVAGHGTTGASGRHYLQLPDTDAWRLTTTAFPTDDVVAAVLGSRARHALIIVNACDAGGIDKAVVEMIRDLAPARRDSAALAVLAAADFDQSVPIGAFGTLLERLFERLVRASGITSEYLSLNDLLIEMDAIARADPGNAIHTAKRVWATNEHQAHFALPIPDSARPMIWWPPAFDRSRLLAPRSTIGFPGPLEPATARMGVGISPAGES